MKPKKYPKLTPREKELASGFIAEEIEAGLYPRKQAIAIGISRARRKARGTKISRLVDRYQ
jgi:Family of unknown function (DUF6496)